MLPYSLLRAILTLTLLCLLTPPLKAQNRHSDYDDVDPWAGFEQFIATLSLKERTQLAKALDPILARDDVVAFCGGKK